MTIHCRLLNEMCNNIIYVTEQLNYPCRNNDWLNERMMITKYRSNKDSTYRYTLHNI